VIPTGDTGDAAAWPDDAIEVGRIAGAWGVKGWVKIQPFASDPQALLASRRWFLKPPEGPMSLPRRAASAGPVAAWPTQLEVSQARSHSDGIVAQVNSVADRAGAEALRGLRIFVSRSSFPAADPDEYYWVDLIGMQVVNLQGESLGTVVGLLDTGPHSVLRIAAPGGEAEGAAPERLVPFVGAYVSEVSTADKRITVDWGLDY
jgi:16S rRNA processing protein RimM